jgi:hypothetical protein
MSQCTSSRKYTLAEFEILENRALRPPTYNFSVAAGPEISIAMVFVTYTLPFLGHSVYIILVLLDFQRIHQVNP